MTARFLPRLALAAALLGAACSSDPLKEQKLPFLAPPPPLVREAPPVRVRAGARAALLLSLRLPSGARLHPAVPFQYRVMDFSGSLAFDAARRRGQRLKPRFPISLPFSAAPGDGKAVVQVYFTYCRDGSASSCRILNAYYSIAIAAAPTEKARRAPLVVEAY